MILMKSEQNRINLNKNHNVSTNKIDVTNNSVLFRKNLVKVVCRDIANNLNCRKMDVEVLW